MAIIVQAIGVFEAPAKTAEKPKAAKRFIDKGMNAERALPRVVPINTSGVNSPPLNPDPILRTEKIHLKMGTDIRVCSLSALLISSNPRPAYE